MNNFRKTILVAGVMVAVGSGLQGCIWSAIKSAKEEKETQKAQQTEAQKADSIYALDSARLAQEHLSFKGVPMGNDVELFVRKLQAQGLEGGKWSDYRQVYDLSGAFAGQTSCNIEVYPTDQKAVWKVVVETRRYGRSDPWDKLKGEYDELVRTYTQKYGAPTRTERYFDKKAYCMQGMERMQMSDVGDGFCHYSSMWEQKRLHGRIRIWIDSDLRTKIEYEDLLNHSARKKEIQKEI